MTAGGNGTGVALDVRLRYAHPLGSLRPYFDGLSRGEAMATRCDACSRVYFPPRVSCCDHGAALPWHALPGTGAVVAATTETGTLPATEIAVSGHLALIAMDGADNLATGRLAGFDEKPAPGARVRLTARPEEVAHPAQRALYVPE